MIGRRFGHYRIVDRIGKGGMGEVFLAEDTSLHRLVALKFLPAELAESTESRARFLVEARAAAGAVVLESGAFIVGGGDDGAVRRDDFEFCVPAELEPL